MTNSKRKKLIERGYLPKKTVWQKLMKLLLKRRYGWCVDPYSSSRYVIYYFGYYTEYNRFVELKAYKVMKGKV